MGHLAQHPALTQQWPTRCSHGEATQQGPVKVDHSHQNPMARMGFTTKRAHHLPLGTFYSNARD